MMMLVGLKNRVFTITYSFHVPPPPPWSRFIQEFLNERPERDLPLRQPARNRARGKV